MTDPAAKPLKRLTAKVISENALILGFQTDAGESFYLIPPNQLNELIGRLLVISVNPTLLKNRAVSPVGRGGVEKSLTLPIERIAASHAPAKGTVGIALTLPSGFHMVFEMPIPVSLALSQQLQSAAGKAQAPKSTAKH